MGGELKPVDVTEVNLKTVRDWHTNRFSVVRLQNRHLYNCIAEECKFVDAS